MPDPAPAFDTAVPNAARMAFRQPDDPAGGERGAGALREGVGGQDAVHQPHRRAPLTTVITP